MAFSNVLWGSKFGVVTGKDTIIVSNGKENTDLHNRKNGSNQKAEKLPKLGEDILILDKSSDVWRITI